MADIVTIKVATLDDEVRINQLHHASFSSLLSSRYDDSILEQIVPIVSKVNLDLLNSGSYYMALNDQGEIVACGGWTHENPSTRKREAGIAHIRHFSTHPDWVRRGIAKKLYNYCKKEAQEVAVTKFICYSTLGAGSFYETLGFKTIKQFDLAMGEGLNFPTILMECDL
jgi:N-acetylglutamate synthase-like GNAT family acetyltransferase